jgi:type VI secretion system protein
MTPLPKYCTIAFLLVNLTACGALEFVVPKGLMDYVAPKGTKLAWDGFSVFAVSDANLNSPIALDVVVLRDEASLTMVSTLAASKWFSSRSDLVKTFPQSLRYRSLEVAPGQTLRVAVSEFGPGRVTAVMVFADYLTPGEHRVRVDQLQGEILVQLGTRAFTVTAQPAK